MKSAMSRIEKITMSRANINYCDNGASELEHTIL